MRRSTTKGVRNAMATLKTYAILVALVIPVGAAPTAAFIAFIVL